MKTSHHLLQLHAAVLLSAESLHSPEHILTVLCNDMLLYIHDFRPVLLSATP